MNVLVKNLANKQIKTTNPLKFNVKNLPMKQKKVYPNELKPIMDYILNQINSTKVRKDDTYHKIRLIKTNKPLLTVSTS